MKIIFLKKYGHFLSGRSLPKKIVAELNGEAGGYSRFFRGGGM